MNVKFSPVIVFPLSSVTLTVKLTSLPILVLFGLALKVKTLVPIFPRL